MRITPPLDAQGNFMGLSPVAYVKEIFSCAGDGDGALCIMDGGAKRDPQSFLAIPDIRGNDAQLMRVLDSISGTDAFVSFSTYKGGKHVRRNTAHIANIYAWSVDVDFVNEGASPEDYLQYIMDNVSIPEPSFVEFGHRLRLIYVLSQPIRVIGRRRMQLLAAFQFLQQCVTRMINDELSFGGQSFGAESNPPTSFFRLPGSINSKDGSVIRVFPYSEERYSFQEVFDEFVPTSLLDPSGRKKEWYESWKKKKGKKKPVYGSVQGLWLRRLEVLKSMRTSPNVHRKKMCFVYACGLVHAGLATTLDELYPLVLEFNEGFLNPLPFNKVYARIKLVPKKPYKFTDAFLAEFLEVDPSLFAGQTRKERDHARYEARKQLLILKGKDKPHLRFVRRKNVLALKEEGLSLKEMAKKLSVSVSTVKRDLALLRTEIPQIFAANAQEQFQRRMDEAAKTLADRIKNGSGAIPAESAGRLKGEENRSCLTARSHIYIRVNKNEPGLGVPFLHFGTPPPIFPFGAHFGPLSPIKT